MESTVPQANSALQTDATQTTTQAGAQDATAGQQPAQTTTTEPTTVDPRAFAARLAQDREKIRAEERERLRAEIEAEVLQKYGLAPQQGATSPPGLVPPAAAATQTGAPGQVDWNQLNNQVYEAFMQNPAGTLLALSQVVAQQLVQPLQSRLQEYEFRANLADLAQRYPDLPQVAPVMQQIIQQRPDLWQTREGLELAYLAAKGQLSAQQAQQLVQQGREQALAAEKAKAGAVPTSGEANAQGGSVTPEQAVVQMILNAR